MSQTSFIFAVLFIAWLIFTTMRGNLSRWLDIVGL